MTRLQFHLLLKNYLDNKSTPEELALVESWYELLESENFTELSDCDFEKVEGRLWHKIQAQTIYKEEISIPAKTKVNRLLWRRMAVAATVAAVAISALFLYHRKATDASVNIANILPSIGYKAINNNSSAEMLVSLSDSTSVTLKPGAKLYYPLVFSSVKREVYLEGAAFFSVKKNPLRPFFVYNGNIVTHVLGTSFWVKPDTKNKKVDVEVVTGRVEVYENKAMVSVDPSKGNGVILLPNQKVTYSQLPRKFETALVENPILLSTSDKQINNENLVFEDTPLSIVINKLQKMYGVRIILENEAVGNCPFTGDISKLDLYKQLDVLCRSIGKTYEIKGTDILIIGNGCN